MKFAKDRENILEQHEKLIQRFKRFCEIKTGRIYETEQAERILLNFISKYSIDILGKDYKEILILSPDAGKDENLAVVGAFIREIHEEGCIDWDYLVNITKSVMLSSAIFLDYSRITSRFNNTTIYFDTTFLIFMLGYAGAARQESCKALIDLLYEKGANLACFFHTIEEIEDILRAIAGTVRRSDSVIPTLYGIRRKVFEFFVQNKYSPSDIEFIATKVISILEAHRIKIVGLPEFSEKYNIDEAKFREYLKEIQYSNEKARNRDIDSINAIAQLRHVRKTSRIEDYIVFLSQLMKN